MTSTPDLAQENPVVAVGSRLAVYWDGEDRFFAATLTAFEGDRDKAYWLEYDDGDEEWVDLHKETYRLILSEDYLRQQLKKFRKEERRRQKQAAKERLANEFLKDDFIFKGEWIGDLQDDNWVAKQATDYFVPISEKVKLKKRRAAAVSRTVVVDIPSDQEEDDILDDNNDEEASSSSFDSPRPAKKAKTLLLPTAPTSCNKKRLHIRKKVTKLDPEAERLKKESAKPLTMEQIREILGEDPMHRSNDSSNWVRRSVRQPSRSLLSSPLVQQLLDNLRNNDTDMVVLKMKKYVNDPNAPQIVLDAVLDALEENTNCQALYIQNFNEGMQDKQVLRLLSILQQPSCKIWCLNIGETYKVKTKTWTKFAKGLKKAKITHMYASEHTITPALKEEIRGTIRKNRRKHSMHNDPENLDVIIKCTHCWWNPVNAECLRPFLKRRGLENILDDKEAQGLKGTMSGASLS